MSRYSHKFTKDDVNYVVSHGYDNPLQEYFLHVEIEGSEEDEPHVWEGNRTSGKCNSDMMNLYTEWGVEEHFPNNFSMLTMDLPF